MKIRFSPQAETNLRDTIRYIGERSPRAAKKLGDRVLATVKRLAEGEFQGQEQRLTTGEVVQSWPVPPLRIFYQRRGDVLWVLRVYHQARRPISGA